MTPEQEVRTQDGRFVRYTALEEPFSDAFGRMTYGCYMVGLPDGFRFLVSHVAHPGTISVAPVDLDTEPDFVEALFVGAEKARESYQEAVS